MYLLIVFLPIVGCLAAGVLGRFLGERGAALVTTLSVFFSAIFSFLAFYEVALSASTCTLRVSPWFCVELFDPSWGFYFDSLTVVMLLVITTVSTLVHIYSISYMSGDPHLPRFMCYLSLFTFFMIILVTSDNFLEMFLGWEGVGLASYLLINFWFTRLQASKASIKAMLVNRVGDMGLALGIMAIFLLFRSVDFPTVFACVPYFDSSLPLSESIGSAERFEEMNKLLFLNKEYHGLTVIGILLFVGAVGKSAQLGLHTWLPDAMEGPTPVSALIHAATMVTAGVFLLARCSPLFEYAPTALIVVTCVGGITCFFAATTGMVQNDLKRVIAYSTCSQLGYMVVACGISHYGLGIFHFMNHAFFKALLFLSAGSVIHGLSQEQDMRKMGGVAQLLPFTYGMMLIGSLSIVGFPFLTGFYSKDMILEIASAKWTISGQFAYGLTSLCVGLTSYYSFRLLFMTFCAPTSAHKKSLQNTHDAPFVMAFPLIVLALGSIFVGYLGKEMMVGLGTNFWGNAIFTLPNNTLLLEAEYISQFIKILPLISTVVGAFLALLITCFQAYRSYLLKISKTGRGLYIFLNKRWLFDKVYNDFISQKALHAGYTIFFKSLDKGCFEVMGPSGIIFIVQRFISQLSRWQSGKVYHYAVVMLLGLVVLIALIGVWEWCELIVDPRLWFLWLTSFLVYSTTKARKAF